MELVFIGQPAIISREGVREIFRVPLSAEEKTEFNYSVKIIKDVIKNLKL